MDDGRVFPDTLIVLDLIRAIGAVELPSRLLAFCDIKDPERSKNIRTIDGREIETLEDLNNFGNSLFGHEPSELCCESRIKELISHEDGTRKFTLIVDVSLIKKSTFTMSGGL